MKHTFGKQATRAGIALAAVGAFTALGIQATLADPPTGGPTFASASITIVPDTVKEGAGGLKCSWREFGLSAGATVYYDCTAGAVGALKVCTYKNRVIFNSPTKLDVFKNVQTGEHGSPTPFLSQANGQVSASITTAIPQIEVPEGQELCTPPSVEEVAAVRWCNASLVDVTNGITGATVGELFQEFIPSVGTVPSCGELLQ